MRKWPLLITSVIGSACLPFVCLTGCNKNEPEKKEVLPESIEIWYGNNETSPTTLYEGTTLDFHAKVLPEEAEQQVVFESSNSMLAKFDNNNLIPTGIGVVNVTAYPVGYPGFKSKTIQITIDKAVNPEMVDESKVVVNEPLITGLSGSYGIHLSNFKINVDIFLIHRLTAKIRWVSEESMEDAAAGITNIKTDSFHNSLFDLVCSFKTNTQIKVGHTFTFAIDFYFDGSSEPIVRTSREYSVMYAGESELTIDDSEVTRIIDFNHNDYLHASLSGFKTNFDFGSETIYQLSSRFSNWNESVQCSIVNKQKEEGWTRFDLDIKQTMWWSTSDFDQNETSLVFFLNNVEVFITPPYQIIPIDNVTNSSQSQSFEIQKDGTTPKLLISDFTTNFDFTTESSDSSLLTVDISTAGGKNKPLSYSILKKSNRTFDMEIVWEDDIDYFDATEFYLTFYLGNNKLCNNWNFVAKYNKNTITFSGDKNVKIDYDTKTGKYFSIFRGFVHNFLTREFQLFSVDLTFDDPKIVQPTAQYTRSSDTMTWELRLYWDQKPDFSEGSITGTINISYNDELLLNDLDFVISEPQEDNYYDLSLKTTSGQMEVIKNKHDETIEIGIKDIDLTKKELCGYYIMWNNTDISSLVGSIDYDPTGEYKIKISVQPSYLSYIEFSPSDKIAIGAMFKDDSTKTINLEKESELLIVSYPFPSLQTKEPVTLKKGETYYITIDLSQSEEIQKLEYVEEAYFVCGSDPSDMSTWQDINEPFHSFCETQGLNQQIHINIVSMMSWTQFSEIKTGQINIVWTPDRDITNVHLALGVGAT